MIFAGNHSFICLEKLSGKIVKQAKIEFMTFLHYVVSTHIEQFLEFELSVKDHGLDSSHFKYFEGVFNLVEMLELILTSSYGQAFMEWGFSFEVSLLIPNLPKESLTWQQIISDHMNVNDLSSYETGISPTLRHSLKAPRQGYVFSEQQNKYNKDT